MDTTGTANPPYALGHSDFELRRLSRQARLIDPMTRRLFVEAGIGPGMRVLDVGSGAGDVAILLAELVGPSGEVVGVDMSAKALSLARGRVTDFGLRNVAFLEGDPSLMEFDQQFDAIAGRYVLMFVGDPTGMLSRLRKSLRPGGIVAFHEVDWDGARSRPSAPLYDRCCQLCADTLGWMGADPHMGPKLHSVYLAAGLQAPTMRTECVTGSSGVGSDGFRLVAELAMTLLPDMERLGLVDPGELGAERLPELMLEEAARLDSVAVGRSEIGAWCRN